jgi:hypothetical protein
LAYTREKTTGYVDLKLPPGEQQRSRQRLAKLLLSGERAGRRWRRQARFRATSILKPNF